ncbi:thiopeptide maturation pyridine synthase [Nonomuraea sp. NPDC004297]
MMWRTYEVSYYADPTGLLLDAVRPFMEGVAPHVRRAYHTRHWLRGPHIRISVEAAGPVRSLLDATVGRYLAEHPSRARIDPVALLERHRRSAEREHERGPLTPLRPDNTVHEAAHDRRLHVLGSESAADLLTDFYCATDGLAFDMLEHVRGGGRAAQLAFDVMIASAHRLSGAGLRRGFVSFRSHSEAFLSWWPEAEGLRRAWDAHYAAHAPALTARVRALVAAIDRDRGLPPLTRRWLAEFEPIRRRGAALIAAGELSMDPPWAGRDADDDAVVAEMRRTSAFHARPRPPGEIDRNWFETYRLVLNYTYLQLTRLGLGASERFLLCHLAACAAEDVFGVTAAQVRLPAPGEVTVTG